MSRATLDEWQAFRLVHPNPAEFVYGPNPTAMGWRYHFWVLHSRLDGAFGSSNDQFVAIIAKAMIATYCSANSLTEVQFIALTFRSRL